MDIDHLDSGEFLQDSAGGESGCQGAQPGLEGDLQAIGEEGDKDVCLDPAVQLVVDRADAQVTLELFERLFDTPSLTPL
jgi:hypothetical protein